MGKEKNRVKSEELGNYRAFIGRVVIEAAISTAQRVQRVARRRVPECEERLSVRVQQPPVGGALALLERKKERDLINQTQTQSKDSASMNFNENQTGGNITSDSTVWLPGLSASDVDDVDDVDGLLGVGGAGFLKTWGETICN
jgi:hypothetical protein